MAANTAPLFALTPNINGALAGGTANTDSTGGGSIGTSMTKIYTAGANGSRVDAIRLIPVASVAGTSTAGTVLRIFISSLTTGTTSSSNTWLVQEIAAPSVAADNTSTANFFYEIALNLVLPAGFTILVGSHVVNSSNTGWMATVRGGDF